MALMGKVIETTQLSAADRRRMLWLMQEHYENVSEQAFESDLNEKQWVILLLNSDSNELCGFSTQTLMDAQVDGRPVRALFSGDTIIHRSHWGGQALSHTWLRFAGDLIDRLPDQELWWFLISSGYKTYRYLPLLCREFFPCYDKPTPRAVQSIIDVLARQKYPEDYDPMAGVIRAGASHYYLRSGLAEITDKHRRDPHVEFFANRNPGHERGDELCCLARLTRDNFTPATERVFQGSQKVEAKGRREARV